MNQAPDDDSDSGFSFFADSDSAISSDAEEDGNPLPCLYCGSLENCTCERNNVTDFFPAVEIFAPGGVDEALDHWVYHGPNGGHNPENDND
jgi:hypothetical protein